MTGNLNVVVLNPNVKDYLAHFKSLFLKSLNSPQIFAVNVTEAVATGAVTLRVLVVSPSK